MDSPLFRPGAIAAGVCTIVQAMAWLVLSVLGLLTATEILGPEKLTTKDVSQYGMGDALGLDIVACYFPRGNVKNCCTDKLILRGDPMLAISIVYLLASLGWLCIAILLVQDLTNKEKYTSIFTQIWGGVTICISVLDFIIVILFGIDFNTVAEKCELPFASDSTGIIDPGTMYARLVSPTTLSVPTVLMTLAARGYVLWLLNVIAAVLLLRATFGKSTIGHRSRRSSNSSDSSVYQSPAGGLQESRSMVFQGGDRPWGGGPPMQRSNSTPGTPQYGDWDRPESAAPARYPDAYHEQDIKRGGLASRMSMTGPSRGPAPQPPQPPQKVLPTPKRPTSTGATIPEPDYDPTNLPRPNRSALKKSPSSPAPPPNDWRQPSPQQNNSRNPMTRSQQPQTPVPITPDGRGGWAPADNRWGGGYDNRGYQSDGSSGGRWGRTGF